MNLKILCVRLDILHGFIYKLNLNNYDLLSSKSDCKHLPEAQRTLKYEDCIVFILSLNVKLCFTPSVEG